MIHCLTSIDGLANFGLFMAAAIAFLVVFTFVYTKFTPYDEMELIKDGNNAAASALGGAMIGFALPLFSVMSSTADILDLLIWGAIALVIQLVVFVVVRKFMPTIVDNIIGGQTSSGVFLGACAIVLGIITAGAVSF